jgi:hypothetical protein
VVSIPTASFAEMQLENLAVRDRFLLRATLGLSYETTGTGFAFSSQTTYLKKRIYLRLVAKNKPGQMAGLEGVFK